MFCGVAQLVQLVFGDRNAGDVLHQEITFLYFLFVEFLPDCYMSYTP